jgi:hypothetical protein
MGMGRVQLSSIVLCVFLAAACGDEGPATIELGTGEVDFEPIQDMQSLVLVQGPQGGYHFVANARIQSLAPGVASMPGLDENPITEFFVYREDGSRIDAEAPATRLGYELADDGWYELPSGTILGIDQQLVEEQDLVPAIYSERVLLRVEVLDADGISASAETWVIPQSQ